MSINYDNPPEGKKLAEFRAKDRESGWEPILEGAPDESAGTHEPPRVGALAPATPPGEARQFTAAERKDRPLATGVLDYFPDALLEVARVSKIGNDQHNPGQPLHWAKEKSTDHADALLRHLVDRGTMDTDGGRHSAKVAWRALALLQTEIERERGF